MHDPIRVLCADDNAAVSESLRLATERAGGLEWVGSLPSADELLDAVARLRPDVVVVDLEMPGTDPLSVLERLAHHYTGSRAILYTGHVTAELVDRAFEAGAWGYVSKAEPVGAIIDAIRNVARGSVVVYFGAPVAATAAADQSRHAWS